jgi:endoglucanase
MKGENILSGSSASFGTDFSYSPSKQPVVGRNYTYLANRIKNYATYIENLGFPVYFGEFGAARTCFVNNKGGEKWVRDCMNIFDSLGYHFTYHAYKESSFGLYDGWDLPVQESQVNPLLKTVFENYFSSILTVDDKSDFKENFKIFPNPVNEHLTIENSNNNAWRIVDLNGVEVMKGLGKSLYASSLANGFYILEINNTRVKFQKIK